jgi:trehalose-phosphatase
VISARPATDLRLRVGLADLVYAGNRGLEIWRAGRVDVAPEAAAFRQALEAAVSALYAHSQLDPRLHLEDAGSAVFVHFRQGSDVATIRPLIEDVADQQGLRVFEGRTAFELRPPMLVDKGQALWRLVEDRHLSGLIYIGDDAADLDAFRMTHSLRADGAIRQGIAVGVVAPSMPDAVREEADVLVEGIAGVEALLQWLLESRRRWIKAQEEVEGQPH